MVSFSKKAKEEILKSLNSGNLPENYFLRLGVKGSSCSANFIIGFDTKTIHDEEYFIDSIKLLIDKRQLMFIVDAKVDFHENDNESGFVITR